MNIVFMGTPDLSVYSLEALASTHHRIQLVVTQPDKPKGRGRVQLSSPVKLKAGELGLPVAQPQNLRDPNFIAQLENAGADLYALVAFSMLPPEVLKIPARGCVNVHGSLLPRLRGAAPVQWAIVNGDPLTGVTVFQLDEKMDHGKILSQRSTSILPEETAGELAHRLLKIGASLLVETLYKMENDKIEPWQQDHRQVSLAPKLKKSDGLIDWTLPAEILSKRIRGFNPYPVCFTHLDDGKSLRIYRASVVNTEGAVAGRLSKGQEGFPEVECGQGRLRLIEVQLEGRPVTDGVSFCNGLQGRQVRLGKRT